MSVRHSDAVVIAELLSRAGYRSQWLGSLANLHALAHRKGDLIATVLCHRSRLSQGVGRTVNQSQYARSDQSSMPSQLPVHLRSKRVIIVSDCTAEDTVVSLLQDGAHHCFNLNDPPLVLQVRLEAALRRHGRARDGSIIQGDIRFDLQKRRVTRAGKAVDLSPKEFELAVYLFSNRGRVVDNSELMTSIWSLPPEMDTRRIDTAACRVRKKLKLDTAHGWELKRLRRIGYRLVAVSRYPVES
ncbi:MAG: response regulator transcription factor [Granulosicoccus sp.]|nr:response regulator transcription factor [Granulosicoccus sp.]